jgi:hypothetical protein
MFCEVMGMVHEDCFLLGMKREECLSWSYLFAYYLQLDWPHSFLLGLPLCVVPLPGPQGIIPGSLTEAPAERGSEL